jgi:hypothetical protein
MASTTWILGGFRGVVKYDVETGTEETVEDAYWAAAVDLG